MKVATVIVTVDGFTFTRRADVEEAKMFEAKGYTVSWDFFD